MRRCWIPVALIGILVHPGAAQIAIPDVAGDRVMLFDADDGSLIDPDWITDVGAVGWAFSQPTEARVVGSEIWVSDQAQDALHRFDLERNYLGSVVIHPAGGNLDTPVGFGTDGSRVYATTFGLDPARRGVAVYDASGTPVDFLPINGLLFDSEPFLGDLLVANSDRGAIERRSLAGSYLGDFATGLNVEQVEVLSDGSVLASSWAGGTGIEGAWHFNADGSLRRYIDTAPLEQAYGFMTPNGVALLGDGNYLIAGYPGVFRYNVATDDFTEMMVGVNAMWATPVPEPAAVTAMAVALAALMGRRRGRRD